jgi:hypothetical protein
MDEFEIGNLVVVAGGTIDKSQACNESVALCRVHAVGEADLLVKEEVKHYPTFFKVSKELCTLIKIEPALFISAKPLAPELGDLVMSFPSSRFDAEKKKTLKSGILYEITVTHGSPSSCKILYDNALEETNYSNLIVLQKYLN